MLRNPSIIALTLALKCILMLWSYFLCVNLFSKNPIMLINKKIIKLTFTQMWALLVFLGFDFSPAKASEDCISMSSSKTFNWSINKIKQSKLASISNISCEDVNLINKMKSEDIRISSGRKRGQSLICLTNDLEDPCKHIIGIIDPSYVDTTYVLSEVFSFTPEVPTKLNETVERLFLKPSSLIQ